MKLINKTSSSVCGLRAFSNLNDILYRIRNETKVLKISKENENLKIKFLNFCFIFTFSFLC